MELKEALQKRRSIRKFKPDKVSDEQINELLHAAMSGPSACNKTPWEFFVITDEKMLYCIKTASRFTGYDAPLALVVCGNLSNALPRDMADYWIQDCSAASENILLRATDMGLGSVWCGIFPQKIPQKRIRELLQLPDEYIPLNIIYIGYPQMLPDEGDQYDETKVHYIR